MAALLSRGTVTVFNAVINIPRGGELVIPGDCVTSVHSAVNCELRIFRASLFVFFFPRVSEASSHGVRLHGNCNLIDTTTKYI